MVLAHLGIHLNNNNNKNELLPHIIKKKIDSKWTTELNIKSKTAKLLKGNSGTSEIVNISQTGHTQH